MSLILTFDKSSLQRLSHDELLKLSTYYMVCIPQVLIFELLGDLSKDEASSEKSEKIVQSLSRNLRAVMPKICADSRGLAVGNLLGQPVPMDGRIPMAGGVQYLDHEGKLAVAYDVPQEMEAMFRWHLGKFSSDERATSLHWRQSIKAFDVERYKKYLTKLHPKIDGLETISDVVCFVDNLLKLPNYQRELIVILCAETMSGVRIKDEALSRWDKGGWKSFETFAPYGFHYLRISLCFYIGLQVGAISTRKSNWIDIEYLRYLPFCNVFSSGDKLQIDLANALLRKDQDLITADQLKSDMAKLLNWWDGLSKEARFEEAAEYGSQPPELPELHTFSIWSKKHGTRKTGRGNLALKMTEEENKALFEKLRPQMEAMEAALKNAKKS